MTLPLIGITVDNRDNKITSGRYESSVAYSRAVAAAGGLPLLLPQEVSLAGEYIALCDGLMLTGGDDARTDAFGVPLHPKARCVEPQRQAFELALLDALAKKPQRPALGVCLGMQMMALHGGGRMNQHLPDTVENAVKVHQKDSRHTVVLVAPDSVMIGPPNSPDALDLSNQTIVSAHHQGVEDAGDLRVVATAPDAVIEAIDDPSRPFYVGVQWHPERGGEGFFNLDLIKRFVAACARSKA